MAYLGNAPARSFISFEKQVFTIVNSQTAYTLDHSVNNENDLRLVINNIVQEPGSGKAYTASGTTLTLSAALTNGTDEMYCVFLGRATATNAPGAGSVGTSQLASDAVTEAKIADDAVESEHLNDNVISGQTELASEPADTDEFLVSDAGTLKRIDYSLIKGGGIEVVGEWRVNNSPSGLDNNDIIGTSGHGNWEQNDTQYSNIGSAMSVADGVFTFPSTGIYLVMFKVSLYDATEQSYFGGSIMYTNDNSSYNDLSESYTSLKLINSTTTYGSTYTQAVLDVTDTSNVKVKFKVRAQNNGFDINGSSGVNKTFATFIRLGDT